VSEKIHQASSSHYQIRVDGEVVGHLHSIDSHALERWAEICEKNDDCYVDIVRIDTQIIISQYEYHQMKRHFNKLKAKP